METLADLSPTRQDLIFDILKTYEDMYKFEPEKTIINLIGENDNTIRWQLAHEKANEDFFRVLELILESDEFHLNALSDDELAKLHKDVVHQ